MAIAVLLATMVVMSHDLGGNDGYDGGYGCVGGYDVESDKHDGGGMVATMAMMVAMMVAMMASCDDADDVGYEDDGDDDYNCEETEIERECEREDEKM